MVHYVCKGSCADSSEEIAACETQGCSAQWEMMEECACVDGKHGKNAMEEEISETIPKDSNGAVLHDGDTVTLIKDLKLKGSSAVLKVGTKASNIRLTDNADEIDCKIGGTAIVLRCEFVKKIA